MENKARVENTEDNIFVLKYISAVLRILSEQITRLHRSLKSEWLLDEEKSITFIYKCD